MSSSSHLSASHRHNASLSSAGRSSRKERVASESREFASPNTPKRYFEPTAATDQMLLYGRTCETPLKQSMYCLLTNGALEGDSVVVANHDTLTIERRFSRHSAEVQLLAVDTQSATMGNGRFVVSYDVDMTAIVWDLMTGEEVARFSSYENLTCAVWMRNGNVAFGTAYSVNLAGVSRADFNRRQCARKRHSLRAHDVRTHIRTNHRSDPYHCIGSRC